MEEKIVCNFIIEMMGRPPKYVKETLTKLVVMLGDEKGIKILNKKIHEPKKIEKVENLFTSFTEIEAELDKVDLLFGVIFKYMPSHIEIISPENLRLNSYELGFAANEITRSLHKYDELAKILSIQKNILEDKLKQAEKELKENKKAGRKKQNRKKK